MSFFRLADGGGDTLVSNGVPLPPGALLPATLNQVRVTIAGAEQSVYVEALDGRHRDGSVRFMLLQLRTPLPSGAAVAGRIELNTRRTTTDLLRQPTTANPPEGVVFGDAAYMSSALGTTWPGPMKPLATITSPAWLRSHSDRWAVEATRIWNTNAATRNAPNDIAIYDLAASRYGQFLRTADPTWFVRGYQYGESYRQFCATRGPQPEWLSSATDLVMHYWFSGDTRVLPVLTVNTNWAHGQQHFGSSGPVGNWRAVGRGLFSMVLSKLLGFDPGTNGYTDFPQYGTPFRQTWNNDRAIEFLTAQAVSLQLPDGRFAGTQYGGYQKHYMVAMAMTGFILVHDLVTADARIPAMVKKACDHVWAEYELPTVNGVRSGAPNRLLYCSTNAGDCGTPNAYPALAGLWVPVFYWYAQLSGDLTYRDRGDVFVQYVATDFANLVYNNRALDEAYWFNFQGYAWRP